MGRGTIAKNTSLLRSYPEDEVKREIQWGDLAFSGCLILCCNITDMSVTSLRHAALAEVADMAERRIDPEDGAA